MKQWQMRYKAGLRGVLSGVVEASTLEIAIELGKLYCERNQGCKYLGMEDPVLISEEMETAPTVRQTTTTGATVLPETKKQGGILAKLADAANTLSSR